MDSIASKSPLVTPFENRESYRTKNLIILDYTVSVRVPDYPRQRHYFLLAVPVSKEVRGFLLHATGRRDHSLNTFLGLSLENILWDHPLKTFCGIIPWKHFWDHKLKTFCGIIHWKRFCGIFPWIFLSEAITNLGLSLGNFEIKMYK